MYRRVWLVILWVAQLALFVRSPWLIFDQKMIGQRYLGSLHLPIAEVWRRPLYIFDWMPSHLLQWSAAEVPTCSLTELWPYLNLIRVYFTFGVWVSLTNLLGLWLLSRQAIVSVRTCSNKPLEWHVFRTCSSYMISHLLPAQCLRLVIMFTYRFHIITWAGAGYGTDFHTSSMQSC